MKTAMYSRIIFAENLADAGLTEDKVIRRAQSAGYSLVVFEGFDDTDLGFRSKPGPRRAEADKNAALLREIEDLFPDGCGYCDIRIQQTVS